MASKEELAQLVVSLLPWRPGLMTAGQQTSIPETELWKAKNVGPDLDGMLSKRPGITQWGQTIKSPDKGATDSTITAFSDFLSGTTGYTATDNSSSVDITTSTSRGTLQTNTGIASAADTTENYLLTYDIPTVSVNKEWSLRFMFRGTNMPAYSDTTDPHTFVVRGQGDDSPATGKEFAIYSDGIYWKQNSDSKYVKVTNSDYAGAGTWNCVEIQCDDSSGNTLVYLNDILLQTLTSADLEDVSLIGMSAFEFRWEVEASAEAGTQYTTRISTPMYNDTISTPFTADIIVALKDYQFVTGGSTIRSLLMAAGGYIYHDRGLENGWRPLHPKQDAFVYFAPYRTTIVWTDNNGARRTKLWQWDGLKDPEWLKDASATGIRFIAEHQQRLFGWGDVQNPRRLYYSGDRLPDTWFSPAQDNTEDEFETLLDAGYMEIQSSGKEIRSFIGDYYGIGVIGGEKGFWKVSGHGVFSYRLDGIKVGTGSVGAKSMVQVSNDIWSIAPQGIASLAATDQFGDLQASFPSVPIQNLWSTDVSSADFINLTFIINARLTYNVRQSGVYVGVPLIEDQVAKKIFFFNTNTKKFYGPWPVDCQVLETVEVASPVTEVTMVGGDSGQVGYFNPFTRWDFGTGGYTMEIETAAINGRSIDPKLIGMNIEWKRARLYILPRGDWNFTMKWWTDTNPEEYDTTREQLEQINVRAYVLDSDMRLDLDPDGFLRSGEDLVMHEIDLDVEGHDLTVNIQQTGDGEDLAVQGIELIGLPMGFEGD